ncbi:MAG TPA: class I SAM-dependent methyltransferase [Chloroflexota bacterium]|nr:class I SAM-dependent methyltransferase [Chloroflexota bacterium]
MRGPIEGWRGDGNSTLIFGEFLEQHGGHLWTCDLDPEATERSRFVTRPYSAHITYVTGDSIDFLAGFDRPIDLLYLDSYDTPRKGNAGAPQRHNLRELKAALPHVSTGGIILLDDNWYPNGGKTRLSKTYLLEKGWLCLLDSQQSLWIRS